jgi:thiol:disulfide interchange protein/DsbC/DsbD-like thiol-disulfide interchange protein
MSSSVRPSGWRVRLPAVLGGLGLLALAWALPAAASDTVRTDEVRAQFIAHAPNGVAPGRALWLGLKLEHAPQWHTYWKNPGDSGLPTTLAWTLPTGVATGEIDWPTPERLPFGPLINYGYENTVVLPVPVQLDAGWSGPRLEVALQAEWLVCKTECIPQSGDFRLSLPADGRPLIGHARDFEAAWAARPNEWAGARATARVDGGALQLTVDGLPPAVQGRPAEVFPETGGVLEPAAPVTQDWQDGAWRSALPLNAQRSASPEMMPLVLRFGPDQALRVTARVEGGWPAGAAPPTVSPALQAALDANAREAAARSGSPAMGWGLALLAAAVGGLLLNLMPCVFPVLSLKLLGAVQHAHTPRERVTGGLAYTAGVVLSFLALAGLLLALRAAGEQLGWGFQLQSPAVVAALAGLFTVIGLNLAGVFEFGSLLPSGLAAARARHPMADSFLSGLLAVAVASPCTAPFMGASLGLAVTWPPAQALSVFAALGLGMALPYLLVTAVPALARRLPRPGPWMAQFRTAMAFPMFATVVWLLWVLGHQVGIDGAAVWLGVLVALGFAAWAWASPGFSRRARWGWGLPGLLVLGGMLAWAAPALREPPVAAAMSAPATPQETWQPWSPQAVQAALAQGRPVFVDFTATWCVTCQVNKRTTLSRDEVLDDFQRRGVLLLRADWTRRDPAITQALAALGRNGIPVYALYRAGQPPVVMSEILTVPQVREALAVLDAPA